MPRICKKCGGAVGEKNLYCIHCGMPLEKETEEYRNDRYEEDREEQAKILTMKDYLLILILMAIPVVNFIVCIVWILNSNGNPNRRNFAKAWLVLAVIGTILSGIVGFGLFQFLVMDHYVPYEQQFEYRIPEEYFEDAVFFEADV